MAGGLIGIGVTALLVMGVLNPLLKRFPALDKLRASYLLFFIAAAALSANKIYNHLVVLPGWTDYLADNSAATSFGVVLGPVLTLILYVKLRPGKGHAKDRRTHRPLTLTFSGTKGKTTVTFHGIELLEDPGTKDRYGAGPTFEEDYPTAASFFREAVQKGLPRKRWTCPQCGETLPAGGFASKSFKQELSFKGMKPFTLEVEGPIAHCPQCGAHLVPDIGEVEEAETKACEKGRLVWDGETEKVPSTAPKTLPSPDGELDREGMRKIRMSLRSPLVIGLILLAIGTHSMPVIFGVLALVFLLLMGMSLFLPLASYDDHQIVRTLLFRRARAFSWADLVSVKSAKNLTGGRLFNPSTRLQFAKGTEPIPLSQFATRRYLSVLEDIVHILDRKGMGPKVDALTRLYVQGGSMKGGAAGFLIAGLVALALFSVGALGLGQGWTYSQWPLVPAKVIAADVKGSRYSRYKTYTWTLLLEYPAGYQGQRTQASFEGLYIDNWQPGQSVDIRYGPGQPAKVVLAAFEPFSSFRWGSALVGLGFLLIYEMMAYRRFFAVSKA